MSARSDAWYAIPENQEKRQRNMRLYQAAQVQLSRRYPEERGRIYRQQLQGGASQPRSMQRAYASVRASHPAEFREILDGLRAEAD